MSSGPRVDLGRLGRRIVIDTSLLKCFAKHGGRQVPVAAALDVARQSAYADEGLILDFLESYVREEPTRQ